MSMIRNFIKGAGEVGVNTRLYWLTNFTLIIFILAMSSCRNMAPENEDAPPDLRDLTPSERQIITSDNRFGLKLFRALNETQPDSNIFISPLSISMALGMTLNGAADSTYEAMASTLEKTGLSETVINESYRSLIDLLTQLDPKVAFRIANSIWYRREFSVEQSFLDVNRTYFDAEIESLDFNSPEAVDVINQWVDDQTNGKIEKIVTHIDPLTVMYLINAIYFKGTWMFEFDEDQTQEDYFYNSDGSTSTISLMVLEATLPFLYTDTFMAVDLPYGDSLFSMTIFLPHPDKDINDFIEQIEQGEWDEWITQFSTTNLMLFLPRFKLEYYNSLKGVLSALGMQVAFKAGEADFRRINPNQELYITDVIHKTFVEVNEEGTEAAAVTAVSIEITSIGDDPLIVRVDRPFVFVIREQHSGTVLFIGKIVKLETS